QALVERRTLRYSVDVQMPTSTRQTYCPNQAIRFTVDAPDRPDQTYVWRASGGNPRAGSGPSFSTSFDTPGRKRITLTVRWGAQVETEVFDIDVDNLPEPIMFLGNPIRYGEPIRFEVASSVPNYTIMLNSAIGQTLWTQQVANADCRESYSFLSSDLVPGAYQVSIIRGGEITAKTLIID
ncbi:MAG: hypothetical protein AAFP02_25770, partial [Bacteroidota bacterium]